LEGEGLRSGPALHRNVGASTEAKPTALEPNLYQRAIGYSYKAVKVMPNNGKPVYAISRA